MRKKPADQRVTLYVTVTSPTAVYMGDARQPRPSLLADDSMNSNSRYTSVDTSAVECQRSTWPSASLTRRNFGRFGEEVDDEVDESFDVAVSLAAVVVAAADADDCERASRESSADKYLI